MIAKAAKDGDAEGLGNDDGEDGGDDGIPQPSS